MRLTGSIVIGLLALVQPQQTEAATVWDVDHAASHLGFTVTIGGARSSGAFESWSAEIDYDPTAPQDGRVKVTVDIASAIIDLAAAQSQLLQPVWLSAGTFPQATFEGTGFSVGNDGSFALPGTLSLKGMTQPLVLTGTLAVDGDAATATIVGTITRADHGVGPPTRPFRQRSQSTHASWRSAETERASFER